MIVSPSSMHARTSAGISRLAVRRRARRTDTRRASRSRRSRARRARMRRSGCCRSRVCRSSSRRARLRNCTSAFELAGERRRQHDARRCSSSPTLRSRSASAASRRRSISFRRWCSASISSRRRFGLSIRSSCRYGLRCTTQMSPSTSYSMRAERPVRRSPRSSSQDAPRRRAQQAHDDLAIRERRVVVGNLAQPRRSARDDGALRARWDRAGETGCSKG